LRHRSSPAVSLLLALCPLAVFGFPPHKAAAIIGHFQRFGEIVRRVDGEYPLCACFNLLTSTSSACARFLFCLRTLLGLLAHTWAFALCQLPCGTSRAAVYCVRCVFLASRAQPSFFLVDLAAGGGNWTHIRYKSPVHAEVTLSHFDLHSDAICWRSGSSLNRLLGFLLVVCVFRWLSRRTPRSLTMS
jgi:hypothetical protein